MKLDCLTWNTAGRRNRLMEQADLILGINPDIVALQEVIPSTVDQMLEKLEKIYPHQARSSNLRSKQDQLSGKRRYGQVIASKYPLKVFAGADPQIPWKERVLSTEITIAGRCLLFHTTHVPPGSTNGWIKIDTLSGIYQLVERTSERPTILCGDFNTPKAESIEHGVITFAQFIDKKGELRTKTKIRKRDGAAWDWGERCILEGLEAFGISDSFRKAGGNATEEYSWLSTRKDMVLRRRLDHFFASEQLQVLSAEYLHGYDRFSDHSPLRVSYNMPM